MATFTIELRSILDRNIPIWDDERPYPIYDEAYRAVLNRRIEDHYRYHEIGFETIDQFIDRLNHKMRLNMPALNKFYESTFMEFDPMVTQRFVRDELSTLTGEDSGTVGSTSTAESTAESSAKSRAVNSDFPQTMLSETGDYASSASDSVGENDSSSTSESQDSRVSESITNRDSELKIISEGMSASPSALLLEFRETILNVDLMVINELSDLFMGIWNTGDEYGSYVNYMYPLGYLGGTY